MSGSEKKHNWLQERIFSNPGLIGLPSPIAKSIEFELFLNGVHFVVPDIFFKFNPHNMFIEIKSGNSIGAYDKGMRQLERINHWHSVFGYRLPESRLIMPAINGTTYWHDMLNPLRIYRLGNEYEFPSSTIYNGNR